MAFGTVHKVMQPLPQYLAPKHFYHSKVKPVSIKQLFSHTSLHEFPGSYPSDFCFYGFIYSRWSMQYHTVNGLLCLGIPSHSVLFQGSSVLLDVSVLHSFSWLHNIPWQGHAAICLYIRLFMDVWAVSIVLAKKFVFIYDLMKNVNKFSGQPIAFWSV